MQSDSVENRVEKRYDKLEGRPGENAYFLTREAFSEITDQT